MPVLKVEFGCQAWQQVVPLLGGAILFLRCWVLDFYSSEEGFVEGDPSFPKLPVFSGLVSLRKWDWSFWRHPKGIIWHLGFKASTMLQVTGVWWGLSKAFLSPNKLLLTDLTRQNTPVFRAKVIAIFDDVANRQNIVPTAKWSSLVSEDIVSFRALAVEWWGDYWKEESRIFWKCNSRSFHLDFGADRARTWDKMEGGSGGLLSSPANMSGCNFWATLKFSVYYLYLGSETDRIALTRLFF